MKLKNIFAYTIILIVIIIFSYRNGFIRNSIDKFALNSKIQLYPNLASNPEGENYKLLKVLGYDYNHLNDYELLYNPKTKEYLIPKIIENHSYIFKIDLKGNIADSLCIGNSREGPSLSPIFEGYFQNGVRMSVLEFENYESLYLKNNKYALNSNTPQYLVARANKDGYFLFDSYYCDWLLTGDKKLKLYDAIIL